jgi:hypothetical protein
MADVAMEREGKAAGIMVAVAHVGCCVCCVLCFVVVICVGGRLLATILVESQHQPRQNDPFLHTHITKLALKHPKYDWMCKLVIIQRCCTHFDFLPAMLFGQSYECAKIIAKIC